MDENGQRAIDHAEGTLNSKVIAWHKVSARLNTSPRIDM